MEKILITPRSFGKNEQTAFDLLKKERYQVVINSYGSILTKEQMIDTIKDVSGIIVGVDPLDKDVLSCAKKLKAVAKYGVGTDNIDLEYCKKHNILVSITQGANANAVADCAFAFLCSAARNLVYINDLCHKRDWTKVMGLDIYKKTIGILGLGAIGKGLAKRAAGFDMNILAYDVYRDEKYAKDNNITYTDLNEIFEKSDFISLHLPLTEETHNIINQESLGKMKKNCIIINTARGGLIDESALIEALKSNRISGACLDVFNEEPPANIELYSLKNLIMGSHTAASTQGASDMMSLMSAQNIIRDLKLN